MYAIIHQILPIFFIFPAIIHCKNSCPISTCALNGDLRIQYPFMLQTNHPPEDCYSFINLRCDDQGQVVINLPSSGDFYVNSIDYVLQKIALTDPGNCLLGRFMMSNISPYPLEAYLYNTYVYYSCPRERINIMPRFTEIPCLSNSVNATIVTADPLDVLMEEMSGCTAITNSLIPITLSDESNVSVNFSELQLTWTVPRYSDDSKSKSNRFLQSSAFIGSTAVLITFSGLACLLRISKLVAARDMTANNIIEDAATTESSAATSTTVAPPQATNGTLGTHEKSRVKIFSEVAFLGDSQGTLVSCSICLEEYNDKDRVKILDQCGHYFHVQCIDEWLHKNNSCPVCRTSLS